MFQRIVFMGSAHFSLPILKLLKEAFHVVGIVTQPDRPAGRGNQMVEGVVKKFALNQDIPIFQPEKINEECSTKKLDEWDPDLVVVVAYGQILKPWILNIPEFGCVNIHASLLPRWRGASPLQAALLHGDSSSGVSIIKMDEGMDSGPILAQQEVKIEKKETYMTLSEKLSKVGAWLLHNTLPLYFSGKISLIEQDQRFVTFAPLLKKGDGALDFNKSSSEIERQVRAYNPWPGTYMEYNSQQLKILEVQIDTTVSAEVGKRLVVNQKPAISTGCHNIVLEVVQPAGKKPMTGAAFLRGVRNWIDA